MRKIYSFIAFAIMMVFAVSARAAVITETLCGNAETCASYFEGYVVLHTYNFQKWQKDGEALPGGLDPLSIALESTTINGAPSMQITSDGMTNFFVGVGRGTTASPDLRGRSGYGFYEFGSGTRQLAVSDMKKGMIIVIQGAANQSYDYFSAGAANADAEEITDEVHALQDAEVEEGGESVADSYRYFRMVNDGYFCFNVVRACYLTSMAILMDGNAEEAVSAPALKVVGVDGSARLIEFKAGESTLGAETRTYWGVVEEGEVALYLTESGEVERNDTIFDEEGVVIDVVPVFKKVIDKALVEEYGVYGDRLFDSEEDGYPMVDEADDIDGDGYVTVQAATVNEATGAFSDIIELKIAVNAITLNAPTLTLVGMDGLVRSYQIGWTNNTICGEDFSFEVEFDDDMTNEIGIGSIIDAKDFIHVRVLAEGYTEGEYDLDDLLEEGVKINRKNEEKANAGQHDWDFVNIPEEMSDAFYGRIIEKCYLIEDGDTTYYTVEEYERGVGVDGKDLSGAEPVAKNFGWWLPVASNRISQTVIEGGYDMNPDNGYGYAEDLTGIYGTGLSISCPPVVNSKGEITGQILKYLDKTDDNATGYLGLYFMSRPTFTLSREMAGAGDYVIIYQGKGGSNYTNTCWLTVDEVPEDALFTKTLDNGGIHVFYIDVYHSENAPEEDPYVVGVDGIISPAAASKTVYGIDGRIVSRKGLQGLQRGLYIIGGKKVAVK